MVRHGFELPHGRDRHADRILIDVVGGLSRRVRGGRGRWGLGLWLELDEACEDGTRRGKAEVEGAARRGIPRRDAPRELATEVGAVGDERRIGFFALRWLLQAGLAGRRTSCDPVFEPESDPLGANIAKDEEL